MAYGAQHVSTLLQGLESPPDLLFLQEVGDVRNLPELFPLRLFHCELIRGRQDIPASSKKGRLALLAQGPEANWLHPGAMQDLLQGADGTSPCSGSAFFGTSDWLSGVIWPRRPHYSS